MKATIQFKHIALLLPVILLALVLPAGAAFASSWISFDAGTVPGQPRWLVEQERNNQADIHLRLPGIGVGEAIEGDEIFHHIDIPGSVVEGIPGSPPVYCLRKFVILPPEGEIDVNIQSGDPRVLSGYKLYPAQPPLLEGETKPFEYNKAEYQKDKWHPPDIVQVSNVKYYREWRLVRLTIHPVQFNPYSGRLKVYPDVKVRITTAVEEDAGAGAYSYSDKPDAILQRLAINADFMVEEPLPEEISEGVEYLMISAPAYYGNDLLRELEDYYESKGVVTSVVSTTETGSSVTQIKNYIQSVYDDGGDLRFVLLVGDINDIPYYTHSGIPGDYYYSLLSGGDEIPDVSLGRFSVKNTTELERMVENSLNYNRGYPGGDWFSKIALVAHRQDYPGKYTACKERIYDDSLKDSNFQVEKIYGGAGGTNTDVTNSFRAGVGIVNYRGHGSNTAWTGWASGGGNWTKSDVCALNSGDYRPLVIGSACWNGNYLISERCLAEEFVLCESGGASGYWGSTKPSYTVSNHTMDEALFAAMVPPYEISNIGEALQYSLIKVIEQHTGTLRLNIWMYVWFGDPYIPIYDSDPIPPTPTPIPYEIVTDSLPAGTVDVGYSALLEAEGGVPPFTWSVSSGSLPDGLSLAASTGAIGGEPRFSSVGPNSFRIRALDSSGDTSGVEKDFDIFIHLAPLELEEMFLPDGIVGSHYSYTFGATGGAEPYTWSIADGSLPAGLSLDPSTGMVSGLPAGEGTGLFTISVEDAASPPDRDEAELAIHINQPGRALVDNFATDHSELDQPGSRDGLWWDRGTPRSYQLGISDQVYLSGGAALKVDWAKASAWDMFQFDLTGDAANYTDWYDPEAGKEAVSTFEVRSSVEGVKLRLWLSTGETSDQWTFPSSDYQIEEADTWQTIRVDWKPLSNSNDFRRVRKLNLLINSGETGGSGILYIDDVYVLIGEQPSPTPPPPAPTATPDPGRTPTPVPTATPVVESTLTPTPHPDPTSTPVPPPPPTPEPTLTPSPAPTAPPEPTPPPAVTPTVPPAPSPSPTAPPPEYEDWIAQYPDVGSQSGPFDDPDEDGWNNLAEYRYYLMTGRESDPSDPSSGGQAVPLSSGWNLVSITLDKCWYDSIRTGGVPPESVAGEYVDVAGSPPSWAQVFGSIAGEYDLILNQAAGDSTYNPEMPWISTLNWIGPDKGFWIKMKAPGLLVLEGGRIEQTGGEYPPLQLYAGSVYSGWTLLPFLPGIIYYTEGQGRDAPEPSDLTRESGYPAVSDTLRTALNMDVGTWNQVERIQVIYPSGGVAYQRGLPDGFQSLKFLSPGYGLWIQMDEAYPGGEIRYREQ